MSEKHSALSLFTEKDSILPKHFRELMKSFGAAVHIVTTDGPFGKRGVTVSSCCSLSDEPATLLVCLHRSKKDNDIFLGNKVFCLNTLQGSDHTLSNIFSGQHGGSQEERFKAAEWSTMKTGSPALSKAILSFDCELVRHYAHATHYILIGEVVSMRSTNAKTALIYLNRKYHEIHLENLD